MTTKGFLRICALIAVAPAAMFLFVVYRLGLVRFLTASRCIAMVPGSLGASLRRLFYRWTLAECGSDVYVDWMAVLKTPTIRVGRRCFIGSGCFVAECVLLDDVQIGHHSVIQGGPHTHGFERTEVPISQQPGVLRPVTIGPDVWIGAGARVLSDVAPGTVVGAGAVVTRRFERNMILAGVPARPLRERGQRQ